MWWGSRSIRPRFGRGFVNPSQQDRIVPSVPRPSSPSTWGVRLRNVLPNRWKPSGRVLLRFARNRFPAACHTLERALAGHRRISSRHFVVHTVSFGGVALQKRVRLGHSPAVAARERGYGVRGRRGAPSRGPHPDRAVRSPLVHGSSLLEPAIADPERVAEGTRAAGRTRGGLSSQRVPGARARHPSRFQVSPRLPAVQAAEMASRRLDPVP